MVREASLPNRVLLARSSALAAAFVLLSISGCGNGLATVTGQVTMNGEPIIGGDNVRATVYLFPEGGTGAPAVGLLNKEGRYKVSTGSQPGVFPGSYVVTISASELIPSRIEGEAGGGRAITPRRYADPSTSGLRVEVGDGSNEFDFDLVGPPPGKRRR